jgi:hypothetical protein
MLTSEIFNRAGSTQRNAEKKELISRKNEKQIEELYSVLSEGSSEANQRRSLAGVIRKIC